MRMTALTYRLAHNAEIHYVCSASNGCAQGNEPALTPANAGFREEDLTWRLLGAKPALIRGKLLSVPA
jgi:hypothetical protein